MEGSTNSKNPLQTITSNPNSNNVINEEAMKYFTNDLKEENPIILDKWTNIRYYNLQLIFDSFYPLTSLNIAKNTSKEERIAKKIKDTSFTYGEIVNLIILLISLSIYIISNLIIIEVYYLILKVLDL